MNIVVKPHMLLELGAFQAVFAEPLEKLADASWLMDLLTTQAAAPVRADDRVRESVRRLLRLGGYKPSGRGKPASEYLQRTVREGSLGSINAAVDACNVVSLHSGLPISVVDLDRCTPPLTVEIAPPGASYVFNSAGQEIRLDGLLCLTDASGPCANAVKDSQRTKTGPQTRRTLSLIWGSRELSDHTTNTRQWYQSLLERTGARIDAVELRSGD
jgi:DNA/RNA-binding domain of Phe-tRNA-synthetase-like protein